MNVGPRATLKLVHPYRPNVTIRPTVQSGVYTDGAWLFTRNLVPGKAVYGEGLAAEEGIEYRKWDATRSKLAAYLKKGGRVWPFGASISVLYLGAGSGTTVSHVSDVCPQGAIVAIEISPRVFRDLVAVAAERPNLIPLLADAARPDSYRGHVGSVDVLYQDVAQRDQVAIFLRNTEFLRPGGTGFLMLKARSVNVAARPQDLYDEARQTIGQAGLEILDTRPLDPFQDDHAAIVARRR
jgi:fibrillarin-like pre-rRNA processing protein